MKVILKTSGRYEKLPDLLRKEGIEWPMPCGGQGTCGKCAVRVLRGTARPLMPAQEELLRKQGLLGPDAHLGCRLEVCGEAELEFVNAAEEGFYIPENTRDTEYGSGISGGNQKDFAVLIDIGTTTICFALTDAEGSSVCAKAALLNRQRSFGADVISRIKAAGEGHLKEMQRLVLGALEEGICSLTQKAAAAGKIKKILIAGNTTMLHLLMGRDPVSLGTYPFDTDFLGMEKLALKELIGNSFHDDTKDAEVTIFPGISAFVGADIAAGIYGLQAKAKKPFLLLDLGTNAEMALVTEDHCYVTSAAAGPAFEGGNISCGSGSIPGAVTKVWLQYGLWRYETIDKMPPAGLCGSGLISCIAALRRAGRIDRHGTLSDNYHGYVDIVPDKIRLTQSDIRAFQEAKAAVRSGIRLLIETAGIKEEEIGCLYLAGSFGGGVDPDDACTAGLFPEIFAGRIKAAGNTVLTGLQEYLRDSDAEKLRQITENSDAVSMNMQDEFQAIYVKYLDFI